MKIPVNTLLMFFGFLIIQLSAHTQAQAQAQSQSQSQSQLTYINTPQSIINNLPLHYNYSLTYIQFIFITLTFIVNNQKLYLY